MFDPEFPRLYEEYEGEDHLIPEPPDSNAEPEEDDEEDEDD